MPRRLTAPSRPLTDGIVVLEPLSERFVEGFEQLLDDPEVIRNTRVPADVPPGFAAVWLDRYVAGWRDGDRAGFAVVSPGGVFLGFVGIVDFDAVGNQGEIGYVIAREARGAGVASRALRLVSDWSLDTAGLARVELHIDPENTPSIRVAQKCGYVHEGVLRSVHFKEDLRADVALYSLLPGDPRG